MRGLRVLAAGIGQCQPQARGGVSSVAAAGLCTATVPIPDPGNPAFGHKMQTPVVGTDAFYSPTESSCPCTK